MPRSTVEHLINSISTTLTELENIEEEYVDNTKLQRVDALMDEILEEAQEAEADALADEADSDDDEADDAA